MASFLPNFLTNVIFRPILRPIFRIISGAVAIPLFRLLLRRVFRIQTTDAELERDLEQWFRGSIILLAATKNLESFLFGWMVTQTADDSLVPMLLRLLLAVGVIENMPDQDLFAILHRGPPKIEISTIKGWRMAWRQRWLIVKGFAVLHLKRSSPVFVIMTVVFGDRIGGAEWKVGWWFYGLAIGQYLIIALITDRDRVEGMLAVFAKRADDIRSDLSEVRPQRRD